MVLPRGVMLLSITPTIDTKDGVCLPMNIWNNITIADANIIHAHDAQQVNITFSQDNLTCLTNSRLKINRACLGNRCNLYLDVSANCYRTLLLVKLMGIIIQRARNSDVEL